MTYDEYDELDDHFDEIVEEIIREARAKSNEERSLDSKRHSATLGAILSGKLDSSRRLEEFGVVNAEAYLSFARHLDSRAQLGQRLFFSFLRLENPTVGQVKAVVAKALQKRKVASGKVTEKKAVVKGSVTAKTETRATDSSAPGHSDSSSEGDDETDCLAPGFFESGGGIKAAPTVKVSRSKVCSLVALDRLIGLIYH